MVSKPTRYYRLTKQGRPRQVLDQIAWSKWMKASVAERVIAQAEIAPGLVVETLFEGIDKAEVAGVPLLWCTRVYGVPQFARQVWKWSSVGEAVEGHKGTVDSLLALIDQGRRNALEIVKQLKSV